VNIINNSGKKKVSYPFSNGRVYFNAVTMFVVLLVSVSLLLDYSTFTSLLCYLAFSAIVTFVSFKLKLHLLFKMQRNEVEAEGGLDKGKTEGFEKWKVILVAIGLGLFLLFPIISTIFLDPTSWFVGFSSFVTGTSISEVVLYFYIRRS